MNDYKGWIEMLNKEPATYWEQRAADIIEYLVRRLDAAVKDLNFLAKHPLNTCDICDGKHCQRNILESGGCNFEWRGVQNE